MSVIAIAELKDGELKKVSKEILSAAKGLGDNVIALLINGSDKHAAELLSCGADIVVKHSLAEFSPQGYANIAAEIAKEKSVKVVLLPHSVQSKDFAGRLAVKLSASVISDVVEISGTADSVELKKPIYSGKAYAKIKASSPVVITVRPNSQEIISHTGSETIESSNAPEGNVTSRLTAIELGNGSKIQLGDASIIVSGGRGIKGPENWHLLQSLCDVLGAALGASRAAVDAGWIEHAHQVGQTGKTVSPNCYIACGISGAIQHLAGMSSSKYIVAVNKDPEAPIFKVATYGIVDDLFEVVPALTEEFKKVLG